MSGSGPASTDHEANVEAEACIETRKAQTVMTVGHEVVSDTWIVDEGGDAGEDLGTQTEVAGFEAGFEVVPTPAATPLPFPHPDTPVPLQPAEDVAAQNSLPQCVVAVDGAQFLLFPSQSSSNQITIPASIPVPRSPKRYPSSSHATSSSSSFSVSDSTMLSFAISNLPVLLADATPQYLEEIYESELTLLISELKHMFSLDAPELEDGSAEMVAGDEAGAGAGAGSQSTMQYPLTHESMPGAGNQEPQEGGETDTENVHVETIDGEAQQNGSQQGGDDLEVVIEFPQLGLSFSETSTHLKSFNLNRLYTLHKSYHAHQNNSSRPTPPLHITLRQQPNPFVARMRELHRVLETVDPGSQWLPRNMQNGVTAEEGGDAVEEEDAYVYDVAAVQEEDVFVGGEDFDEKTAEDEPGDVAVSLTDANVVTVDGSAATMEMKGSVMANVAVEYDAGMESGGAEFDNTEYYEQEPIDGEYDTNASYVDPQDVQFLDGTEGYAGPEYNADEQNELQQPYDESYDAAVAAGEVWYEEEAEALEEGAIDDENAALEDAEADARGEKRKTPSAEIEALKGSGEGDVSELALDGGDDGDIYCF
ncbi:hypothetical protein BC830DRAFT_1166653 [Chytriomyces sp. MP71]|nr:hypothetical protein BC830DRAFT_1166653 [Chytriomyces sp. MP71]